MTGIVLKEHTDPLPTRVRLRDVLVVLDSAPVVSALQLQLWQWMSQYYMCTLGEVLAAALPAGIIDDDYKAKTEQYVCLAPIYTYVRAREATACV